MQISPELEQLGASQRIESHRRAARRPALRLGMATAALSFHSALVHPDCQTSPIEMSTVGFGIAPNLLPCLAASARGLMRFRAITAGGDFHPAPRTCARP